MAKHDKSAIACGLLLAGATSACSSNVGEAIRPKEATATEALGATSSLEACEAHYAKPLIIDISPEDRGDLEAKLKQGGPVVSFDCKSMKVLPTCRMKGTEYKWVGYTPKAQLVEMESGDDLGASLPLNGMSFKAALDRSGRLNLATMTVGQRSAGMLAVDRNNLEGDCAQGTHVVNSVWVGAFKLETGSKGEVMAAADVFGAEAHAASKSARKAMTSDGDVSACEKAREDGEAPPPGCTAFVRLELLKIPAEGAGRALVTSSEQGKEPAVSCPPGREWNGATCVSPEAEGVCSYSNDEACKPKCDKKDGAACQMLSERASSRKNKAEARSYAEKACEYGREKSCWWRGALAMEAKDEQDAVRWFTKGCSAGDPFSCTSAGVSYWKKLNEASKGFTFAKRSCDLGDKDGCDVLALMYLEGAGTPKDGGKAVAIYEAQCRAGFVASCNLAAKEYEEGENLKKDLAAAERILKHACENIEGPNELQTQSRRSSTCFYLAELYDRKKEGKSAAKAYERACELGSPTACRRAGQAPSAGPGAAAKKK